MLHTTQTVRGHSVGSHNWRTVLAGTHGLSASLDPYATDHHWGYDLYEATAGKGPSEQPGERMPTYLMEHCIAAGKMTGLCVVLHPGGATEPLEIVDDVGMRLYVLVGSGLLAACRLGNSELSPMLGLTAGAAAPAGLQRGDHYSVINSGPDQLAVLYVCTPNFNQHSERLSGDPYVNGELAVRGLGGITGYRQLRTNLLHAVPTS